MRKLTKTILLLFVGMTAFGQDFDQTKLNAYFDTLAKYDRFMGSVAISKNGELIYTKSVGYLEAGKPKAADENTKYRIGSISKPFTATLIMKAVEENKLRLDEPIDGYFPTIENAAKITVGQLLSHRSGIADFTSSPDYLEWHTQPKSEAELVAIIAAGGSDFEPDTKANYSNSNYVLLTYLLEKVFEKPYASLLDAYIAQPVGLPNTLAGAAIEPANNEARSYNAMNGWVEEPETDMSIPLGAGAVISTPTDIIRFGEALLTGDIISEASVTQMKTIRDGYGMGLFQIPFHDKQAFGHSGGIDGFRSTWGCFPAEGVSFAMTTNGAAINTNDAAIAVLSAIFNEPYDIPAFSNYQLKEDELQQYLGVYASTQLPIKITITNEGNTLLAQATGQPSFPLEATAKDKFKFDGAGVVMEFDPAQDLLILKQNGGEFTFTKE